MSKSQELYQKGLKHLVGAVNSPVRAFSSVGGNPLFIKKAEGAYIFDADDKQYLDMVLSYGPMILGHKHPKVQEAVIKALENGYSFGASSENEITLAQIVCDAFANIDKIRFVNSGTEAVLSAIRLARAYTKKDKIIKFSGCYHGHQDDLLVAAGSGLATLSMPGSLGVPADSVKNTLIANYNDFASVQEHFAKNPNEIAAIIIEPIAGNMGVVLPENNFLVSLKKLANENGALLIIDEVMTGFRPAFGGAQEALGVYGDIVCLGKIIGGGFPVGAYGARDEIMQLVAPLGGVYQAGTLSGNPIAMAAGIATLTELKEQNPYEFFDKIGSQMQHVMEEKAGKYGVNVTVNRFGSMLNPFFNDKAVRNFKDAASSDTQAFATFFWAMIEKNIFLPPSQFESWFLSSALTQNDLNQFEEAVDFAMKKVSEQH